MKLDGWIIGLLIVVFFVFVGVALIGDVNKNYDASISSDEFNNTLSQLDVIYGIGEGQKNLTLGSDVDAESPLESGITGSFSAIRLVGGTFSVFNAILQDISDTLGIHPVIITFAITVLLVLIAFAFIRLFTGRRED